MIDKLPSLPSDSLYKLGTLCGLALLIGGGVTRHYEFRLMYERLDAAEREHERSRAEWVAKKLATKDGADLQLIHNQIDRLDSGYASQTRRYHDEREMDVPTLKFMTNAGWLLLGVSWCLWFTRHQVHQDTVAKTDVTIGNQSVRKGQLEIELAELEVQKARLELASPPGPLPDPPV